MGDFGISDSLRYNEFVFDSTHAKNTLGNNPLDWPLFFPGKPLSNIAAIKILEVQIPFSYYVFTNENNKFYLSESPMAFAITLPVTIPPGNYTADNFVEKVGIAMSLASSLAGGDGRTYTASYDFSSSKITLTTVDAGDGFSFRLYMKHPSVVQEPSDRQPGPFIGFLDGQLYTSTESNFSTTVTSGGISTLTGASPKIRIYTGVDTHNILLPPFTSTVAGDTWTIYNTSSDFINIKTSTSVLIASQASSTVAQYKTNSSNSAWLASTEIPYTETSLPIESQAKLQAPNVMNLSGPNYIYLCSANIGPLVKLFLPHDHQINGTSSGADGPQIAKIPVNKNTGNIIHWQDPDAAKWFSLDNLANFPKLDFYCSFGTSNENIPLNFNGLGFSIKMGMLTADPNLTSNVGGGQQNNRVQLRQWQPGNLY